MILSEGWCPRSLLRRYIRHGGGDISAKFVVLLVAAHDIAFRIKQYDARDSGYAVEVGRDSLAIDDLRPGQFMLLDGAESVGRLVPYGHAKYVESFGTILFVDLFENIVFTDARAAQY